MSASNNRAARPFTVPPFTVDGGVVLVTGAASGMGRLYALRAAREGAEVVILWDVDADALAGTADEVAALGARAGSSTLPPPPARSRIRG